MERVKAKVCLCGDGGVGKTSLITRFVENRYDEKYIRTLGTRVSKRNLDIDIGFSYETYRYILQLWDIMGQEEYRRYLKDSYFFGCRGVIMVFDLTRRETLEGLYKWRYVIEEVAGDIPTVVLGNKWDLVDLQDISISEVETFCENKGYRYFLTSAKTGANVEDAFSRLGMEMADHLDIPFTKLVPQAVMGNGLEPVSDQSNRSFLVR